ncbi:GerMN domain-containing protein [Egicoccus sp. AB-alg6-2]|uniref:GerMN domain-containing protein n=1 Tax=Egicoccus sp. AB-alg6-2 TaxID=3242692 RepID=UPI00359EE6DE
MKLVRLPLLVVAVLSLLLAACGNGVVDAGPVATDDVGQDAPTDSDDDVPTDADTTDQGDTGLEPTPTPDDATDTDDRTGGTTDTSDDDDQGEATDNQRVTPVRLYFVAPGGGTPGRADPFLVSVQREIPSTQGIALATLRELIDGPSSADKALIEGLSTSVPGETLVLGVNIADGLATVDLSREFESGGGSLSMFSRLAQVIYTVTQFPTVDEVQFHLDGQPVRVFSGEGITIDEPASRADFVDLLPTVFVDTPAAGAKAQTPLRLTGMGAVFEATFQYRLETVDGTVLDEGYAMTDNGMGWGSFDITLDVSVDAPTEAVLTVYEYSAKDGSVQALRETPLTLLP